MMIIELVPGHLTAFELTEKFNFNLIFQSKHAKSLSNDF